jgi:hypothetical protein
VIYFMEFGNTVFNLIEIMYCHMPGMLIELSCNALIELEMELPKIVTY